MESEVPQTTRLRFYLMAVFIPMLVLSLVAFAVLTLFQVRREIEKDLVRRSQIEFVSFEQTLSFADRQLQREMRVAKLNQDLLVAVLSRQPQLLQDSARDWLAASHFDQVTFYSDAGLRIASYENADRKSVARKWTVFLSSVAKSKKESREPSSDRHSASVDVNKAHAYLSAQKRFTNSNRIVLTKEFRNFLSSEDAWFHKERAGKFVELVHYIQFRDSDKKLAGYLEAKTRLDDEKLGILGNALGVELALIDPSAKAIQSSESFDQALLLKQFQEHRLEAFNLKSAEQNLRVFFNPVTNEDASVVAYAGIGLSKSEQNAFERQLLTGIVLVGLFLAILCSFLVVAVSNKITKPISDLVAAVEAMRVGEWVHPVSADSNSEIGVLVSRFNEMAQSVQVTKRMLETKLEELAKSSEQLAQTRDHLIQTEKLSSLGQLVAGVAHELNNPIAFIYSNMSQMKGYLAQLESMDQMIEEIKDKSSDAERNLIESKLNEIEWDYIKKDMKDIVQSCLEGSNRVKDIVLGLRDFSRLDKGGMQEVDLEEAFKKTSNILRGQLKNKVDLHWDFCSNNRVLCSPAQMNQIFMNLLSNAAQAITEKGDIWVRTQREKDSNAYLIYVRDNGSGIAPEHLKKIFDPFFTTKKVGDGTGLGLSIVYGIVERHKGSIEVRSKRAPEADHGTEFFIRIPQPQRDQTDSGHEGADPLAS